MDGNVYMKAEVPMDAPICQYMRLDYFISLLGTREYFVRRRSHFDDAFETELPFQYMFSVHEANKKVSPEILQSELDEMKKKFQENRENGKLLTSCWCLRPYENFLMWHCYASKIGVMIKSTVSKFLSSLETSEYDIICGRMNYNGYSYYNNDMHFSKSRGYESENEFRFYFMPKESEAVKPGEKNDLSPVRLKVKLSEMIDRVIVSPYIDASASKEICDLLHRNYDIQISSSRLKLS